MSTDADLAELRREKVALSLKQDIDRLKQELGGRGLDGSPRRDDPVEQIEDSFMKGRRLRALQQGLGDGAGSSSKVESDKLGVKEVLQLISATREKNNGDSPAQIAQAMVESMKMGMQVAASQ